MRSIICESMPSDRVAMVNQHALRATTEFSLFTIITASDYIISKIQKLQNKFIRLALRLPKYICSKLLHDSTGLPYVKERLLSCTTKSLDRIAQNPLFGESISSNRLNPLRNLWQYNVNVLRLANISIKVHRDFLCWVSFFMKNYFIGSEKN